MVAFQIDPRFCQRLLQGAAGIRRVDDDRRAVESHLHVGVVGAAPGELEAVVTGGTVDDVPLDTRVPRDATRPLTCDLGMGGGREDGQDSHPGADLLKLFHGRIPYNVEPPIGGGLPRIALVK